MSIIEALEARLVGPIPNWMLQAWGMWKADLLLLCGRRDSAVAWARRTLAQDDYSLLSRCFAGPYSRWIGLTLSSEEERSAARQRLLGMVERISQYDALDQLEILCATRRLAPEQVSAYDIDERLNRLPPAIRSQLLALEQLPHSMG
jgi:hypothetical protein